MIRDFWTDGACKGNPGPGRYGIIAIKDNQILYEYSEYCDNTTNNREELKAILHVFELAAADPNNQYIIYSDSAYAVNIINDWIFKWAKNNWINSKGKTIENLDLIQTLYKYVTINFFNCQVRKIVGHAGIIGNELADALATGNKEKYQKIVKENHILENFEKLSYNFNIK